MKALLALEDGFVLEGRSFTGPCEGGGEVIFNTGMTGYQEILTDPSYYGQMVCMTWPLIGNYGINAEDMESGKVHAAALIVKECCKTPSNWRSVCSLPDFLQQHGVPGIEGIDTRALTRHLRMHGAMRGMVSTSITDPAELVMQAKSLPSMEGQNLVTRVMPATPWKWTGNGGVPAELNADGSYNWPGEGPRLVAYDFGIKWNILRLLTEQGFDVLVVPPSFTAEQVKASGAQAVFLSNGPGDPDAVVETYEQVQQLIGKVPVFGICLGHQMISLACGAQMEKLKFGHRGGNQPVMNLVSRRVEITAQNHGFGLLFPSLGKLIPELSGGETEHAADGDLRAWVRRGIAPVVMNERFGRIRLTHVNLNDGTAEGIQLLDAPCFSVQYHPEASPGPTDAHYLFTAFTRLMDGEENYLDIDTAKDRLAGWNFAESENAVTEEN